MNSKFFILLPMNDKRVQFSLLLINSWGWRDEYMFFSNGISVNWNAVPKGFQLEDNYYSTDNSWYVKKLNLFGVYSWICR